MRNGYVFVLAMALAFGATRGAHAFSALMLQGNISQAEYPELSKIDRIDNFTFEWEKTPDRDLPNLGGVDILWIGQGEICENQ